MWVFVGTCEKKISESNKRIWDLRDKRHKGVEKGDKAFLEPVLIQVMKHGVEHPQTVCWQKRQCASNWSV